MDPNQLRQMVAQFGGGGGA
jgi:thiol-disulfide isomerase/thioredoxin